ncbi:c-type cytochrome [Puia sp.]|jgi:thiosulfate dehydrogenase|uniref:c-type cytochrome n=1 Tax=Puia sp. TaxID=2045100 RepID=UPI002F3E290D
MQKRKWYGILILIVCSCNPAAKKDYSWQPPDTGQIPATDKGRLIRYGRDLIVNTSSYLGPKGIRAAISNGMNCQNCHLEAGTKPWGNNYSGVFSTYPKYRDRSGSVEDIHRRVNDCIERSLNGQPLDTNSLEMKAITAYVLWLGKDVPKGVKPRAVGIRDLPWLSRAADPEKGRIVYQWFCRRCHGEQGNGLFNADSSGYKYPPLWGEKSYNTGAGLYRLSRLAGYIKDNMPQGYTHENPLLNDEEAWDVAAFISSRPRPEKPFPKDWPDITRKPLDHPFGPYSDSFPARQHKLGPFEPIRHAH